MNVKTRFSKGEESANAISHGIGLIISVIAAIIILSASIKTGNLWNIYSTAIFGAVLAPLISSVMVVGAARFTKNKMKFIRGVNFK